MSIYSTGTATFTNGSTSVTGSGTAWHTGMIGSMIIRNGLIGIISAVPSGTSLTLAQAAPSGMAGTGSYLISLNTADEATGAAVLPKVDLMLDRLEDAQGAALDALLASSTFTRGLWDNADAAGWRADLSAVSYIAQTLNSTQQLQTRTNIGVDINWLAAQGDPRYTRKAGQETVTQRWNFTAADGVGALVPGTGTIASRTSFAGGFNAECTGGAATMSFVRLGAYGVHFGLDTDNVLKLGGYSMGGVAHAIHHDGRANRSPSYTVSTVPSASTSGAGAMIYVSNESGGAVLAFSDGSNWRRLTDRAVIS